MKIFVTGDNHIGLKYSSHEKADVLVKSRLSAFEGMVEKANAEGCSLFVITGDLFENTHGIAKKDIKELFSLLKAFKGTVAILPGNHDFYDPEAKLWQYVTDVASNCDNILLLTAYRPYELSIDECEVVLYPALCTSLHSAAGENNLGWIRSAELNKNSYNIGIAHGAVEGETIDNEGQYFLMKRSELEEIPVDVWLVGHTHVPFPRNLTEDFSAGNKIFNAGTHVQTDVSCNTDGQCFVIELDENKRVTAKKFVSGNVRFYRKKIAVEAEKMEEILNRELENIDDNSVVEIILEGSVTINEYENRKAITEEKLARFVESKCNDYALTKLISKELIEAEFPETSFSAGLLRSLMAEPKEAQLAYELLKSLKGGK